MDRLKTILGDLGLTKWWYICLGSLTVLLTITTLGLLIRLLCKDNVRSLSAEEIRSLKVAHLVPEGAIAATSFGLGNGLHFVGAGFDHVVDMDPGRAVRNFVPLGDTDIVVSAFDQDLEFKWMRTLGTAGADRFRLLFATDSIVWVGGTFADVPAVVNGEEIQKLNVTGRAHTWLVGLNMRGDPVQTSSIDEILGDPSYRWMWPRVALLKDL